MQNTIILLIEHIVTALGTDFKVYLPQIIPQILKVFMHDSSNQRVVTAKVGLQQSTVKSAYKEPAYKELPVIRNFLL